MQKLRKVGYQLLAEKELEAAISVFEFIVECNPDSVEGYDALGEACAMAGLTDRAIAAYRRALELDPDFDHAAEALQQLGGD